MKRLNALFASFLFLSFLAFPLSKSSARTLVNTSGGTSNSQSDDDSGSTDNQSSVRQSLKEADNGMDLRKIRRVAVGAQAVGDLGFGGALLELNLDPSWGVVAGFGGGEGLQTFEIGAKYVLGGDSLLPYLSLAYSRWASIGQTGYISRTNPSIAGDHLLTEDEREAGQYQLNLLVPSLGLQFLQLKGDWAGASIFAEVNLLINIDSLSAAPTGTLGVLYYF